MRYKMSQKKKKLINRVCAKMHKNATDMKRLYDQLPMDQKTGFSDYLSRLDQQTKLVNGAVHKHIILDEAQ